MIVGTDQPPRKVAICIGCGCDDNHACKDPVDDLPCSWLAIDRSRHRGVCSCCPRRLEAFKKGSRHLTRGGPSRDRDARACASQSSADRAQATDAGA